MADWFFDGFDPIHWRVNSEAVESSKGWLDWWFIRSFEVHLNFFFYSLDKMEEKIQILKKRMVDVTPIKGDEDFYPNDTT